MNQDELTRLAARLEAEAEDGPPQIQQDPDKLPKPIGKHGLLAGEWMDEAGSPWSDNLEGIAFQLARIIDAHTEERESIRDRFQPASQKDALDELEAKTYPKFFKAAFDELRILRTMTKDWQRLFGSGGFSPPAGDARRPYRSELVQTRWKEFGNDREGFLARRDVMLSSVASGDADSMWALLDLPELEKQIMFDEAAVKRAIRQFRMSQHPEQVKQVAWVGLFASHVVYNLNVAKKLIGFGPDFSKKWERDPDGHAGYTKIRGEIATFIKDLPIDDRPLHVVLLQHRLRPAMTLPQIDDVDADSAASDAA